MLQFYLMLLNKTAPIPETIVRFFSFFTILTNILVAICFTAVACTPSSKWGRFFSRPSNVTALAVYKTVTGIVYNVILHFLGSPKGLQFIADELLHSIIPVLFIFYWFIFVLKTVVAMEKYFALVDLSNLILYLLIGAWRSGKLVPLSIYKCKYSWLLSSSAQYS